jgi:hypothetical protein
VGQIFPTACSHLKQKNGNVAWSDFRYKNMSGAKTKVLKQKQKLASGVKVGVFY